MWQCDFRSKKSRELMNSIMASDDASEESEFLSALNASLENFVHKALKMHSKNRMQWRRCFGCVTDGIRQERYVSVNFKSVVSYGPYSQRHIKNHRRTPCFLLAYKLERYLHQVLLLKFTLYERNLRTCFRK